MGEIRQDEGNPGQEEIPDQTQVPARFTVHDPRRHQPNANGTGKVQQGKYGYVITVADEKVA
jgi:hypothetical protein